MAINCKYVEKGSTIWRVNLNHELIHPKVPEFKIDALNRAEYFDSHTLTSLNRYINISVNMLIPTGMFCNVNEARSSWSLSASEWNELYTKPVWYQRTTHVHNTIVDIIIEIYSSFNFKTFRNQ